jgi:hypothetical protein
MELHRQQQEMDAIVDQMRKTLGVDVDGWVSNDAYTTTRELARTIKERMIEAADVQEKEGIRNNFPFDDFDENGGSGFLVTLFKCEVDVQLCICLT